MKKTKRITEEEDRHYELFKEIQQTLGGGLAWHVHHDRLVEWCFDSSVRRAYIIAHKPQDEVKLRLRLFNWVYNARPNWIEIAVITAYRHWVGVMQSEKVPERQWWRYRDRFNSCLGDQLYTVRAKVISLHRKECPKCPWHSAQHNHLYGTIFHGA